MSIDIDVKNDTVSSATITWSREGYMPTAFIYGDRIEIETTFFADNTPTSPQDYTDNPVLKEQWDTANTPNATQKNEDATTTDIYSRFSATETDVFFSKTDNNKLDPISPVDKVPKGYREFTGSILKYDANGEAFSASAMVDDGVPKWVSSGSDNIKLNARVSAGSISYIKFQAGNRGNEFDQKDKNKSFTTTCIGFARQISIGKTESNAWEEGRFRPFTVAIADRFKRQKNVLSRRTNPGDAAVADAIVRKDDTAMDVYSLNIAKSNTVPNVSGSITYAETRHNGFPIGTIIGAINSGSRSVPVGLSVISVDNMFQPPSESGQGGGDSTTIELGRV